MVAIRMSAKEARTNFTDVLGRAYYKGEPTIVEKQGKAVAVVISPTDYERYQKLAKERFFQVVRQIQEDNKDKDPEEVYRDVTEAVEEVRRERHEQQAQAVARRGGYQCPGQRRDCTAWATESRYHRLGKRSVPLVGV